MIYSLPYSQLSADDQQEVRLSAWSFATNETHEYDIDEYATANLAEYLHERCELWFSREVDDDEAVENLILDFWGSQEGIEVMERIQVIENEFADGEI